MSNFVNPSPLEVVVRRCFVKNSQQNTCARFFFLIKLQAPLVAASALPIVKSEQQIYLKTIQSANT